MVYIRGKGRAVTAAEGKEKQRFNFNRGLYRMTLCKYLCSPTLVSVVTCVTSAAVATRQSEPIAGKNSGPSAFAQRVSGEDAKAQFSRVFLPMTMEYDELLAKVRAAKCRSPNKAD